MRKCVFQSLLLLSTKEKRARKINFHPNVTIIRGNNGVGKSCTIKSIYRTFGAEPAHLHDNWKAADVSSLIHFTYAGQSFSMLKHGESFAMFDSNANILMKTTSVTKGLAPYFAKFFLFGLQLTSKSSKESQAVPAFMLLPFYIDQDVGWIKSWSSFSRLQQFTRWRKDVVEFHLGVRPTEYYEAKKSFRSSQLEISKFRERRDVLRSVLKDLEKKLSSIHFSIDIQQYQREIEKLLIACNNLKKKEEELKKSLVHIYNTTATVEAQLRIVRATAAELNADYEFAVDELAVEIECPTCGVAHRNSFTERFDLAKDEARCKELEIELESDLAKLASDTNSLNQKYLAVSSDLEESKGLLNQKQGDVTLKNLIENEGKREAGEVLNSEISQINEKIGSIDAIILELQATMESFTSQTRRNDIRGAYVERMRLFLSDLSVTQLAELRYKNYDCTIPETGSELPRALLAYYFSILHTMLNNQSGIFWPIVIDSPKQQDQDRGNWRRILEFLKSRQPSGTQMILALVDKPNVEFDGDIIDFTEQKSGITSDQYTSVFKEMLPFIEQCLHSRSAE